MDSLSSTLSVGQAIETAIIDNDLNQLKSFFYSNKNAVTAFENLAKKSAIELAIENGHLELVEFFTIEKVPFNLHRALKLAVLAQKKEMIEFLFNYEEKTLRKSLPSGAVFKIEAEMPKTPLVASILTVEPCVNQPYSEEQGNYLIHLATRIKNQEILAILLKRGASPNYKNREGYTPLHIAAKTLDVDTIKLLLANDKINITHRDDKTYSTFLGLANQVALQEKHATEAQAKFQTIIDWSVKKAETFSKNDQQYFFYRAINDNLPNVVKQVLENEKFFIDIDLPYKNKKGWTVLYLAVAWGYAGIAKILIEKGANFNLPCGISLLGLACQSREKSTIELIFKKSINFDQNIKEKSIKDLKENFCFALQKGDQKLVEILLNLNSEYITIETDVGGDQFYHWRPLHFAIFYRSPSLVQLLLSKGASLTAEDQQNRTSFDLAIKPSNDQEVSQNNAFQVQINILITLLKHTKPLLENLSNHLLNEKDTSEERFITAQLDNITSKLEDILHWAVYKQKAEVSSLLQYLLENFQLDKKKLTSALQIILLNLGIGQSEKAIVQLLLARGADLNVNNPTTGKVPLTVAIQQKKEELVEFFLSQNNIELDVLDKKLFSPLHHAASCSSLPIFQTLFKRYDASFLYRQKISPLSPAISANRKEVVNLLLPYFLQPEHYAKELSDTLAWAAKCGHLDIIQEILTHGFDVNSTLNQEKDSILGIAAQFGQTRVVEFLLHKNAKTSLANNEKWSPLHLAIIGKHESTAILLIEKSLVEIHLQGGLKEDKTPLHLAAIHGLSQVAEKLLERHANIDAETNTGKTPLYLAIEHQQEMLALMLLSEKANPNIKVISDGDTALHLASEYGFYTIVRALLDHKTEIDSKNVRGETALHLAINAKQESIAKLLIERGADIHSTIDGITTNDTGEVIKCDGFSTLHLAAYVGLDTVAKKLLDKDVNPNALTSTGVTPLHSAASRADENNVAVLSMFKLLVGKGAKIDIQNAEGITPLYLSAQSGDLERTKYLIEQYDQLKEKGEKVKDIINTFTYSQSGYAHSPIHVAIANNYPNIIKYLLSRIDIAKNQQGWIALQLAVAGTKKKTYEHSNILIPQTPLSPKNYPPIFYSSPHTLNQHSAHKEDATDLVVLDTILTHYLSCCSLSEQEQSTLLSIAITHQKNSMVSFLLNKKNFSPNCKNSNGMYPVQVSAMEEKSSIEILDLLVSKGALINLKNVKTPLSYSMEQNKIDDVEWLLNHNADPTIIDTDYYFNPIHWAIIADATEALKTFLEHPKCNNKKLIKKLIDSQNVEGLTPFHIAVIYSQHENISQLLRYDPDINKESSSSSSSREVKQKWTAMNFALNAGDIAIVHTLFLKRAQFNLEVLTEEHLVTFIMVLMASMQSQPENVSPETIQCIATQFVKSAFNVFSNNALMSEIAKEDGSNFIAIFKLIATMNQTLLNYTQGRPIEDYPSSNNVITTPLRFISNTPVSSGANRGADPRTGDFISPLQQRTGGFISPPSASSLSVEIGIGRKHQGMHYTGISPRP